MLRLTLGAFFVAVLAIGTSGCCSTCGDCKGCGKYWRNLGKPGKHPVGKACCRKCDLCEQVGGPCGGWSKTSEGSGGCDGEEGCGTTIIYEDEMPAETVMPPEAGRAPVGRAPYSKNAVSGRIRRSLTR